MRSRAIRILRCRRLTATAGPCGFPCFKGEDMSGFRAVLLSATSLVAFAGTLPAYAQQSAQASAGSGQLEEIVVTARKTEEKLQVAPVSVTAITTAKLEANNVQSADALNTLGIP